MSTLNFRMLDSGLRFPGLRPGQVIALCFGLLLSTPRSSNVYYSLHPGVEMVTSD